MPLYFVTTNAGKFRELQAILPKLEQLPLELDEIQSLDPQVVIEHKLTQAALQHEGEYLVEDTSLIFHCLNQLPGTFIKWFVGAVGLAGLVELVSHYPDHSATARITIGYRDSAGSAHFFSSTTTGKIVSPRGMGGFGWDAIFLADGQTKTNAEQTLAEKNTFSARAEAARKLVKHLTKA